MPHFDLDPKPLSEKNRLALGTEHARLELERNATKQEQRDANGSFRTTLKELNKRAKEISEQLDQDVYRERVEVDEKPVDATFMVQIFKAGTKEKIGERDMTEAEKKEARKRLQPELPMNGSGKTNTKMSAAKGNGKPAPAASAKKGDGDSGIVDDNYVPSTVDHRGQNLKHSRANKPKGKGKKS